MIGVGLDAVEVERFRRSLARSPKLAARLFTEHELAYSRLREDPTERLAARFAAKEAVMKALGVGLGAFGFHDVEVVHTDSGEPQLRLTGRAVELAAERGVVRWHLSLTHTEHQAQAIAIAIAE